MTNQIPGTIVVADDVIADIAGHAALQCYGVVGMAASDAVDSVVKLLPNARMRKGVEVLSDDEGTHVTLHVILEHGINITTVSNNLMDQITFALKEFITNPPLDIGVQVGGIKFRNECCLFVSVLC